jgi:hypothetical protein
VFVSTFWRHERRIGEEYESQIKKGGGAGRASFVGSHPFFARSSLSKECRKKENGRNVKMSDAK